MGLVLSRKINEAVKIGDDVTVTVLRIRDGKVRLKFDAPKGIPVHREEIYQQIAAGVPLHKIEDRLDLAENPDN